jgi:hypothetical protein
MRDPFFRSERHFLEKRNAALGDETHGLRDMLYFFINLGFNYLNFLTT